MLSHNRPFAPLVSALATVWPLFLGGATLTTAGPIRRQRCDLQNDVQSAFKLYR